MVFLEFFFCRYMVNFALIICCVSLGVLISRLGLVKSDGYKPINVWLIYVALPSLGLRFVPEIEWSLSTLLPCISPFVLWCGAFLFISFYSRFVRKLDKHTRTALLISSGIGNTAFLGFPMVSAFFGEENLSNAIVFDQMTFIMFSTLVVTVILRVSSSEKVGCKVVLKKLFLFPPFIAAFSALLVSSLYDYSFINPFLDKILATLSPLALFSIGLQLRFDTIRSEIKNLSLGLGYKLFIGPLIILFIVLLVGERSMLGSITVFQSSMPAHITSSLLASQYGIRSDLCNMFVGLGIIASLFTSVLWYFILQYFF